MTIAAALIGGLGLGLFMAISVGPTLFAVIQYSMNHSYQAGLAFVLGVSLSDILFVSLANWATPLLQNLHQFGSQLSYLAALLLMGIGVYGFVKKYVPKRPRRELLEIKKKDVIKIGLSGFLINSLNPALIFQWIAAATGLAAESGLTRFVFFGTCLTIVLGIDLLKVLLADKIRKRLTLRKILYLHRTSSVILFTFGVVIFLLTFFHLEMKNPMIHN